MLPSKILARSSVTPKKVSEFLNFSLDQFNIQFCVCPERTMAAAAVLLPGLLRGSFGTVCAQASPLGLTPRVLRCLSLACVMKSQRKSDHLERTANVVRQEVCVLAVCLLWLCSGLTGLRRRRSGNLRPSKDGRLFFCPGLFWPRTSGAWFERKIQKHPKLTVGTRDVWFCCEERQVALQDSVHGLTVRTVCWGRAFGASPGGLVWPSLTFSFPAPRSQSLNCCPYSSATYSIT